MKGLLKYDEGVRTAIRNISAEMATVSKALEAYPFNLQGTEISEAIIARLNAYYQTQQEIKVLLQKRVATAGADFFVESVLFFLKSFLNTQRSELKVHSELSIVRRKGSLRPDISIWRDDEVVAIVECKTQLGWARNHWEAAFEERERKLRSEYPNARAYLLVMTGANWPGFGTSKLVGKKYFCLLRDVWPWSYASTDQILTTIEQLFLELNTK